MKKIVALILVLILLITSTSSFVGCFGESENHKHNTTEVTTLPSDIHTPDEDESPDDLGNGKPDAEEQIGRAHV